MRKCTVVKLVLVNSLLALGGCSQGDDDEKKKKDEHHGSTGRPHGGVFLHRPFPGGGTSRPSGSSSSVGRSGFGSTGAAAS